MVRGPISLSSAHNEWHDLFNKIKYDLESILGGLLLKIEHIGSTSVKGLIAKPTIDIIAMINDLDNPKLITKLNSIDFDYITKYEDKMPFRRYFVKRNFGSHIAHLHIFPIDHHIYKQHLIFKNILLNSEEIRSAYSKLKLKLVEKDRWDRIAYQNGKNSFITKIIDQYSD